MFWIHGWLVFGLVLVNFIAIVSTTNAPTTSPIASTTNSPSYLSSTPTAQPSISPTLFTDLRIQLVFEEGHSLVCLSTNEQPCRELRQNLELALLTLIAPHQNSNGGREVFWFSSASESPAGLIYTIEFNVFEADAARFMEGYLRNCSLSFCFDTPHLVFGQQTSICSEKSDSCLVIPTRTVTTTTPHIGGDAAATSVHPLALPIGIGVGAAVFVILLLILIFCCCKKRWKRKKRMRTAVAPMPTTRPILTQPSKLKGKQTSKLSSNKSTGGRNNTSHMSRVRLSSQISMESAFNNSFGSDFSRDSATIAEESTMFLQLDSNAAQHDNSDDTMVVTSSEHRLSGCSQTQQGLVVSLDQSLNTHTDTETDGEIEQSPLIPWQNENNEHSCSQWSTPNSRLHTNNNSDNNNNNNNNNDGTATYNSNNNNNYNNDDTDTTSPISQSESEGADDAFTIEHFVPVFAKELEDFVSEQLKDAEMVAMRSITEATKTKDTCVSTLADLELKLATAQLDGGLDPFDMAELERQVKAARLRVMLAKNRETRALAMQLRLRKHDGLVARLTATTRAANSAMRAVTQLEENLADKSEALLEIAPKDGSPPTLQVFELQQEVEDTRMLIHLSKERVGYLDDVLADVTQQKLKVDEEDDGKDEDEWESDELVGVQKALQQAEDLAVDDERMVVLVQEAETALYTAFAHQLSDAVNKEAAFAEYEAVREVQHAAAEKEQALTAVEELQALSTNDTDTDNSNEKSNTLQVIPENSQQQYQQQQQQQQQQQHQQQQHHHQQQQPQQQHVESEPTYSMGDLERRTKAAQLRLKLAAAREARALQQQSALRMHHNVVSRMTATAQASETAKYRLKLREVELANKHEQALNHEIVPDADVPKVMEDVATTSLRREVAKERVHFLESVLESTTKEMVEAMEEDDENKAEGEDEESNQVIGLQLALEQAKDIFKDKHDTEEVDALVKEAELARANVLQDELNSVVQRETAKAEHVAVREVQAAAAAKDTASITLHELESRLKSFSSDTHKGNETDSEDKTMSPNNNDSNTLDANNAIVPSPSPTSPKAPHNMDDLERRTKAAKLRLKLAANREARAMEIQTKLRKNHNLASRLTATAKAAADANDAMARLEDDLSTKQAELAKVESAGDLATTERLRSDVERTAQLLRVSEARCAHRNLAVAEARTEMGQEKTKTKTGGTTLRGAVFATIATTRPMSMFSETNDGETEETSTSLIQATDVLETLRQAEELAQVDDNEDNEALVSMAHAELDKMISDDFNNVSAEENSSKELEVMEEMNQASTALLNAKHKQRELEQQKEKLKQTSPQLPQAITVRESSQPSEHIESELELSTIQVELARISLKKASVKRLKMSNTKDSELFARLATANRLVEEAEADCYKLERIPEENADDSVVIDTNDARKPLLTRLARKRAAFAKFECVKAFQQIHSNRDESATAQPSFMDDGVMLSVMRTLSKAGHVHAKPGSHRDNTQAVITDVRHLLNGIFEDELGNAAAAKALLAQAEERERELNEEREDTGDGAYYTDQSIAEQNKEYLIASCRLEAAQSMLNDAKQAVEHLEIAIKSLNNNTAVKDEKDEKELNELRLSLAREREHFAKAVVDVCTQALSVLAPIKPHRKRRDTDTTLTMKTEQPLGDIESSREQTQLEKDRNELCSPSKQPLPSISTTNDTANDDGDGDVNVNADAGDVRPQTSMPPVLKTAAAWHSSSTPPLPVSRPTTQQTRAFSSRPDITDELVIRDQLEFCRGLVDNVVVRILQLRQAQSVVADDCRQGLKSRLRERCNFDAGQVVEKLNSKLHRSKKRAAKLTADIEKTKKGAKTASSYGALNAHEMGVQAMQDRLKRTKVEIGKLKDQLVPLAPLEMLSVQLQQLLRRASDFKDEMIRQSPMSSKNAGSMPQGSLRLQGATVLVETIAYFLKNIDEFSSTQGELVPPTRAGERPEGSEKLWNESEMNMTSPPRPRSRWRRRRSTINPSALSPENLGMYMGDEQSPTPTRWGSTGRPPMKRPIDPQSTTNVNMFKGKQVTPANLPVLGAISPTSTKVSPSRSRAKMGNVVSTASRSRKGDKVQQKISIRPGRRVSNIARELPKLDLTPETRRRSSILLANMSEADE